MVYAIEARESQYQGLHGIVSHLVLELESDEEALEYARQESEDLIISYGLEPGPEDEDEDGPVEEWTDEDYADAWAEAVDYSVWKIPDLKGETLESLDELFYNNPDEFIDTFCEDI